jgi:ferredoxin
MPKVTVEIDRSSCILAALCVGIEPKLFQIGQEPYVELTDASGTAQGTEYTFEGTEAERERIEEAVDSCPTRAIRLQTGK